MRAVIQRVSNASVSIKKKITGNILKEREYKENEVGFRFGKQEHFLHPNPTPIFAKNRKLIPHENIGNGFLVLLGIESTDTCEDVHWLASKIAGLRVFGDENDKMNLSINDMDGNILLISQFTLFASTKKGNRPSFLDAAKPPQAIPLYEQMKVELEKLTGKKIQTGIFGEMMEVNLTNDGPVTIVMDSKIRW